jgi:hypothetical protein
VRILTSKMVDSSMAQPTVRDLAAAGGVDSADTGRAATAGRFEAAM